MDKLHWAKSMPKYQINIIIAKMIRHKKIVAKMRSHLSSFQLNVRPDTSLLKPEKIDDFMAGEMRVNEHPFLTTLHIIFVKEHNRIAKLLKEYLPSALHTVRKI